MKELEHLVSAWDTISGGSVQFKLSQEKELLGIHITPDTATIDIKDQLALDFITLLVKKDQEQKMGTMEHIKEKRSILLGVVGSLKSKRTDITKQKSMIQDIATVLAENKKCVILKEKGKQLAKLGHGADSLSMRLLNLQNVEVNDLTAVMKLRDRIKSK